METTAVYTDDITVQSFDTEYAVYIYSFKRGDLMYSFVCSEPGGGFAFYEIQAGKTE